MTYGAALSGKRALVTGAASGIGKACAMKLHSLGAELTLLDLGTSEVANLAESLGARHSLIDLSSVEDIASLDPQIDILVNNAGFQHVSPVDEFPVATFEQMIKVMLTAPFALSRHALPHMKARRWGRIINISSIHGVRASPYKSAYVSAKHGIEGLSKVIAIEGGAHGITSNCIRPAYVRTPLVDAQIAAQARHRGISPDEVMDDVMLARTAVKRLVEVDEVASAVAYLCSDDAGMMTGASLTLDGGWTAQ